MDDKKIEERYGTEDNIILPRFVWESSNASHERTVKRFIWALVIAVILLAVSNGAWLFVFNQYDFSSESYTIENSDDGNANYLEAGDNGEINNGIKDSSEEENSN